MTGPLDQGGHRQTLDGLRALAIAAVMLFHSGVPGFRSGWVGVDLFFVLSGFLITTLLMDEVDRTGTLHWPHFMARRALRLMPAYAVYAGLVTLAIWWWPGSVHETQSGWTAAGFTAALWGYAINFVPQGGVWNGQGLTVHLWSLAMEQQYYLVWPVLVLLLRRRPMLLLALALALGAAFMAAFVWWPPGMAKNAMLYTRGFSVVLASAAAIAAYSAQSAWFCNHWAARAVSGVGIGALVAMFATPYMLHWSEDMVRERLLPLVVPAFAIWVVRLWYLPGDSWLRKLLRNPTMVYVGQISYGIYLYHEAIRIGVWALAKPLMQGWPASVGFGVRLLIYLGLSVLVAAISYAWLERPCQRLSRRFRDRPRTDLASPRSAGATP